MTFLRRHLLRPRILGAVGALVFGFAAAGAGTAFAASGTTSGTLYFTLLNNQGTCTMGTTCKPNVFKVTYSYNPSGTAPTKLTLGTNQIIATTQGADGIVITPKNNLLVGGQHNGKIYKMTTSGTNITSHASGIPEVDHLTLNGSLIFTAGPSTTAGGTTLDEVNLSNLTQFRTLTVPNGITQIAFVPGSDLVYYTSSGYQGYGTFGTINLSTGETTPLYQGAPWAHGIVYDPFSGDLILAGNNEIAEWNPSTERLVSTYTAPGTGTKGGLGNTLSNVFDQVTVDGQGHLFAAANNGYMYFIDYSQHPQSLSAAGNYVQVNFLANGLDDIVNQLPEVPYAAVLPLMLIPGLLLLRRRRRARSA